MNVQTVQQAASQIKNWYQFHKATGQIPYALVFALTIYAPFEEFILRWILLPSPVIALLRYIPELALYFTCGYVLYNRYKSGKKIRLTPIEPILMAFLICFIISIVVNHASIPGSVSNLRLNWRYLSVYYLVVNIDISPQQVGDILNALKRIGFIQGVIASIQFFLPSSISQSLFTRQVKNASQLADKGASIGTFGDSAILSALILILTVVWLVFIYTSCQGLIPPVKDRWALGFIYFATFASKKRASLVVALILPLFVLFWLKRKKDMAKLLWIFITIGVVLGFILPFLNLDFSVGPPSEEGAAKPETSSYFLQIFSEEYWAHNAENSRGWMIFTVCKTIFKTGSWFGLGPELGSIKRGILAQLVDPEEQDRMQRNLGVYDDPYWFAILGYYGVVGLVLYLGVFIRLSMAAQWLVKNASCLEYKRLGLIFRGTIVITYIYAAIERILVLRPFSFYLWLLAGLVINACYAEREKQNS